MEEKTIKSPLPMIDIREMQDLEKEDRVRILLGEAEAMPTVADFAVDVDFQDVDDQD